MRLCDLAEWMNVFYNQEFQSSVVRKFTVSKKNAPIQLHNNFQGQVLVKGSQRINFFIITLFFFCCMSGFSLVAQGINYFDPRDFQDPVMDATRDFERGHYRIWSVVKSGKMRHPGLKPAEINCIKQQSGVVIEPKNRWALYDDTPLPFDQALTLERYVTRYNRSMLQLLRSRQ